MEVHFKELTRILLIETFLNSTDRKGNRLLNFMRIVCATKNKHVLQAITKLQVLRGQTNGCSYDVKDMIILLLSYFDEKEAHLLHYIEETSLAKDVELENLPVTPYVIVCGVFSSSIPKRHKSCGKEEQRATPSEPKSLHPNLCPF
ncbi:hypothetical protein C0J50_8003 [Silurus asotus]|uniref:Uncharacterized protein n=1 Tax=Silurus asotus TaxID=30991 RepID=A0AAD5B5U9_SILAS|nr:hypothetical protein C0J50_8003 [Silurus asotus]